MVNCWIAVLFLGLGVWGCIRRHDLEGLGVENKLYLNIENGSYITRDYIFLTLILAAERFKDRIVWGI